MNTTHSFMRFCSSCDKSFDSAWENCPECIWRGVQNGAVECSILDDDQCRTCTNSSAPQYETGADYGELKLPKKLFEKGPKDKCCEKRITKSKMCKRCPHWLKPDEIEVAKLLVIGED